MKRSGSLNKQVIIIALFILNCYSMIADTDTVLQNQFIYVTGKYGEAGSTAELTLNMHNTYPVCSWGCDLFLPKGVTFKSVSLVSDCWPDGYEAESFTIFNDNGSVTIYCDGIEDIGLIGSDGPVATITVDIADTVTSGNYLIKAENIRLTFSDGGMLWKDYTEFNWLIKDASPFVQEGKVWIYEASNNNVEVDVWEEVFSLEGDTVIGSHKCLKLYETGTWPSRPQYPSHDLIYKGAMFEEDGKVYIFTPGSTTSTLLYDFSSEPGTIVKVGEFEVKIREKKLVKYRGEYLKVIYYDYYNPVRQEFSNEYYLDWIEGVGVLGAANLTCFIDGYGPWYTGMERSLKSCMVNGEVVFDAHEFYTSGEPVPEIETNQEFFPEGTKWTEIRLDTLKYSSWYSKVGDEWVPNFETIEFNVGEKYISRYYSQNNYVYHHYIYSNSPDWPDSPAFMIYEDKSEDAANISVSPLPYGGSGFIPGEAYQFNWHVGKKLFCQETIGIDDMPLPDGDTSMPNVLYSDDEYPAGTIHEFGVIEEIKEGDFGGVRPLKYVDMNGIRIIHGIGVTEWNDGECLFGPVNLFESSFYFKGTPPERHYRSMLVHFERDGEVLYDVWPKKEAAIEEPVIFTKGQMATIVLPTEPDAGKGKYYRLDRVEDKQIVFERELQPRARVPYIIVPSEDFSIELGAQEVEGLTGDTVSVEGVSFIGTYHREEINPKEGFSVRIIDTTPDCSHLPVEEQGVSLYVGALRAYLLVNWDDPYNPGGTKAPAMEMEIVLKDNPNSIRTLSNSPLKGEDIYDLSGRKLSTLNFQLSTKKKAIYIQNNRKLVK